MNLIWSWRQEMAIDVPLRRCGYPGISKELLARGECRGARRVPRFANPAVVTVINASG